MGVRWAWLPPKFLSLTLPQAQTNRFPALLIMLDSHPLCTEHSANCSGGVEQNAAETTPPGPHPRHAQTGPHWFSFLYWLANLVPEAHLRKDFNYSSLWLTEWEKFSVRLSERPGEGLTGQAKAKSSLYLCLPSSKESKQDWEKRQSKAAKHTAGRQGSRKNSAPFTDLSGPMLRWVPNYLPKSKSGNQVLP